MKEEDDQLYVYKLYGISIPRRFRAQKTLRQRIGMQTKISEDSNKNAQELNDMKLVDYSPHVYRFLAEIIFYVEDIKSQAYVDDSAYNKILVPFVQIKGQAAMFGNQLASDLASLIVSFLEQYRRFDDHVLNIIMAAVRSIRLSYQEDIDHEATVKGRLIMSELQYAMKRYDEKFKKMTGR